MMIAAGARQRCARACLCISIGFIYAARRSHEGRQDVPKR